MDLGSNSWRLVVFSYAPGGWWKLTDELYETVRIGEGLEATGKLSDEAMERGIETLSVFARFCRANRLSSEQIHAVATSAIRDATNQQEFLARAKRETGVDIEVLSARDEAFYGYIAAINTTTLSDGAVVDLGGGSLQLTRVADRRPLAMESFRLGAVRLTEHFLPGDGPAKKKDLARVRAHVRSTLGALDWLPTAGPHLTGIGGAVRNLAAAAQRAAGQLEIGIQGFLITPEAIDSISSTRSPACRCPSAAAFPASSSGAGTSSSPPQSRSRRSSSSARSPGSRRPRPACARACSLAGRCSTLTTR